MGVKTGPLRHVALGVAVLLVAGIAACGGAQTNAPIPSQSLSQSPAHMESVRQFAAGGRSTRTRPMATVDGCLQYDYSGNISLLNLPGYDTNQWIVYVELPTSLASGTYTVDYSGTQVGITEPSSNTTSPGFQDRTVINDTAYSGGTLPYPPCNGLYSMFYQDQAYYPGTTNPVPAADGGYGSVDFYPTPAPTATPTPIQTPTPGPLRVFPKSIVYPKLLNELGVYSCKWGGQPYIPGTTGQTDPDATSEFIMTTDATTGCEKFEGSPTDDETMPSVHVHEKDYFGPFTITGWKGCGGELSHPRWWVKGEVKGLDYVQDGPDGWIQMQGTSSTYSETSCTVTVTGADYKSVTVTVRPGSP